MAELGTDHSQLPPVEHVRKEFAVLEDGVLAHYLQEKEIEQHYASNVHKNRLVQQDIRMARKLQLSEEEVARQHEMDLEEHSSRVAIEMQRKELVKADESKRRTELADGDLARRLQKQEEKWSHRRDDRSHPHAFEDRFTRLQVVQDKDSWKGTKAGADMEKGEVGRKEPEKGDVKRDAELARQLQAEEEKQAREVRKVRVKDEQMARFAQDEEIARYIQQKEIKSNKEREVDSGPENCDVREPGRRAYRHCHSDGESCSPRGSVERSGRKKDGEMAGYVDMTRKDHGLQSRTGGNVWWDPQSQRQEKPPRPPPPKNIAEDLDPTFHTSSAARHAAHSIPPVPALSTNYKDEEREVEHGPRARCTEGESRSASAARGDGKGNGKKENCKQQ